MSLEFHGVPRNPIPSFKSGDEFFLNGSSPVHGWVYLFSIDADRNLDPVYPRDGERSGIRLSRNAKKDLSAAINAKIAPTLHFEGSAVGMERLVVVVVDTEEAIPVTCAHMRSIFPLSVLFAHEQRTRGLAPAAGPRELTFDRLGLNQIAIGTLDYYYEG